MSDYELEEIPAAEARPLRRALLHPQADLDAVDYPGDDHPSALHMGVLRDGVLVAIGTAFPQPMPAGPRNGAWRLVDIAVEHGHRGRGIGAMLLERLVEHAQGHEGTTAWARTRTAAFGFFDHFGFKRAGDPIDDPDEGPQYLVYLTIPPLVRSWEL